MKIPIFVLVISFSFYGCKKISEEKISAVKVSQKSASQDSLKASIDRGALVYEDFCMQCHLPSGQGIKGTFPPLAASDWLLNNRTESIRAIKYGQSGEILVNSVVYNGIMAPLGLNDEEVADVMNYILNSWGNKSDQMVTPLEVQAVEK